MKRKPYYECPLCHAHLDCGERCDCQEEAARIREQEQRKAEQLYTVEAKSNQLVFKLEMGA